MTTHTPGPWKAVYGQSSKRVDLPISIEAINEYGENVTIARMSPRDSSKRMADDSLVLAAAPELLAALKETHKQARGMWNELVAEGYADATTKPRCLEMARAAIAKAEGAS